MFPQKRFHGKFIRDAGEYLGKKMEGYVFAAQEQAL